MDEAQGRPEPRRTLITSRKEYLDAIETLLGAVKRELRIFDPDLSELDFNSQHRIDPLRRLLSAGRTHRVYIALHDVEHVTTRCPRLLQLLATFSSGLIIYKTEGEAAKAQDRFVLADEEHLVRRPAAAQARGVIILNDPNETHAMRERFDQIWESSNLGVAATQSGL